MNTVRVLWLCLPIAVASACLTEAGEPAEAGATTGNATTGAGFSRSSERAPASTAAAEPARFSAGPAINWTFPVFTDKEGYRQLLLRGTEARAINANHIEVSGFHAVVFSGDASERVDTVLLSPQATFHPRDNRASGASTVRLILSGHTESVRDDMELTGRGWTYDHRTKKVSIARDVRVTFHAQLNDILK